MSPNEAVFGTRRRVAVALAAAVCSLCLAGARAQPLEDAAAAQDVVARLHDALADAGTDEDRSARYERLLPVVRATHDLRFIAELTIRRQWRDLDDAEREAFVDAFENLSVATYAARFAGAGPDTFRLLGAERDDDGRVEVRAEIVRKEAENVPLDYLLQRDGDSWRIVNIIADGVSDLALKRSQYQQVFRTGGSIEDLIRTLAGEAAAL